MQYKGEFYSIDTLEKAYILGLLQADGAILINIKARMFPINYLAEPLNCLN